MALKGKKKSRSRGSQAKRRPAAAPRPSYGAAAKPRWYQTTSGLVVGFLLVATLGILIWWYVADSRSDAQELETNQESLRTYTESLDTLIEQVSPVAADLMGAAQLTDKQIQEQSDDWAKELGSAQASLAQTTPPPGLEPMNSLLTQSLLLYTQAAEQYGLLSDVDGKVRDELAEKAAGAVRAADGVFAAAIQLLDEERVENELASSGLDVPGMAPAPLPSTEIELPSGEDEGGG